MLADVVNTMIPSTNDVLIFGDGHKIYMFTQGDCMDFQTALYGQIQNQATWTPNLARLNRRIEAIDGADDPVMVILEQNIRAKLGLCPDAQVDWSAVQVPEGKGAIDWAGLLAFIEQLMTILGPLIGGL